MFIVIHSDFIGDTYMTRDEFIKELKNRIDTWKTVNNLGNIEYDINITDQCNIQNYKIEYAKETSSILKDVKGCLLRATIDSLFRDYRIDDFENNVIVISIRTKKSQGNETGNFSVPKLEHQKSCSTTITEDGQEYCGKATKPLYRMSQLILPVEKKAEIEDTIELIRNMNLIYRNWGYEQIDPACKCLVNFYGPPGTGKTMAVHAVADALGRNIIIVSSADIESKYAGQSQKNLVQVFKLAKEENAVLFFDEADTFLSRRITSSTDSHSQSINALRSQFLMLLEDFDGIVFFATNLHDNYDPAFDSRIVRHIGFSMPDKEARAAIIRSKLPGRAPYSSDVLDGNGEFDNVLLLELADFCDGMAGREIKNIIFSALGKAASSNPRQVTADILRSCFAYKQQELKELKRKKLEQKETMEQKIMANKKSDNFNESNL